VLRREWVAGAFAVSAVFALVTALTSFNAPERVWGTFAAVSYAVSAVTAAVVRRRGVGLAVVISLMGAVAAPLAWMAVTGAALVLMVLAGAGVGAWMIVRPPRDAYGTGWRLALGLALIFVLAPATRVGYFVYPLGLAAWLLLSRWPELPRDLSVDPEPQHRWHAVQGHH
jgi:hypothetical protein